MFTTHLPLSWTQLLNRVRNARQGPTFPCPTVILKVLNELVLCHGRARPRKRYAVRLDRPIETVARIAISTCFVVAISRIALLTVAVRSRLET